MYDTEKIDEGKSLERENVPTMSDDYPLIGNSQKKLPFT